MIPLPLRVVPEYPDKRNEPALPTRTIPADDIDAREQMNIVIVGHVDHGKSTLIGRLLADTGSLPQGKLEDVRARCKREDRVFEYAFLLDALKDEQRQNITIDTARCFFKTRKRNYIIIDAPGHKEFLKNMISGAARAEAAVLVIDAKEGIQENSRRHGYMLAMLGIRQIVVCVNKMDLVDFDKAVYDRIIAEYGAFLASIGVTPKRFIPISALEGDNIAMASARMAWQPGTVLEALDTFGKEKQPIEKPLRMHVQDIYRFSASGDDRRIIAGKIATGSLNPGDKVVFLPSNKSSTINTIETLGGPALASAHAGMSVGFTLTEQIYIGRGELLCRQDQTLPAVSDTLQASIFWMGREPLKQDKDYKLKIGTTRVSVRVSRIDKVLNASTLEAEKKQQIDRYEVAEVQLRCASPIAFDLSEECESTGRFVMVDNYDIAGGGIITGHAADPDAQTRSQVLSREEKWYHGTIDRTIRALRHGQQPKLVLITGDSSHDKKTVAAQVEKDLFGSGRNAYYLTIGNLLRGVDADIPKENRHEHIRRFAEVAHLLMDTGLIVIGCASDLSEEDLRLIQTIVHKDECTIALVGDGLRHGVDVRLDPDQPTEANASRIIAHLAQSKAVFHP